MKSLIVLATLAISAYAHAEFKCTPKTGGNTPRVTFKSFGGVPAPGKTTMLKANWYINDKAYGSSDEIGGLNVGDSAQWLENKTEFYIAGMNHTSKITFANDYLFSDAGEGGTPAELSTQEANSSKVETTEMLCSYRPVDQACTGNNDPSMSILSSQMKSWTKRVEIEGQGNSAIHVVYEKAKTAGSVEVNTYLSTCAHANRVLEYKAKYANLDDAAVKAYYMLLATTFSKENAFVKEVIVKRLYKFLNGTGKATGKVLNLSDPDTMVQIDATTPGIIKVVYSFML